MNPDLVKAARQFFSQISKAKKAGEPASATEEEAYMRQLTNGAYGRADAHEIFDTLHDDHGNAVSSALQGLTGNFFDEIVGKLPEFLGGGEAGKEGVRLRGDMMRAEHPVGDAVAQAAGGVGAALLLPGGAAARGASMGARALQGAKVGALFGGANGLGAGEDLESRLKGGAVGAAAGAGIGAIVPGIVSGIKGLAAPVAKLLPQRAAPAIEAAAPAGGTDLSILPNSAAVTQVVSPLERASAGVQKAIDGMGGFAKVRAANAAQRAAGNGEMVTLADLGKPFTKAADFAANNSEKAHAAIADVVDQRGEDVTQLVTNRFKAALPAELGEAHAPTSMEGLKASKKAWADGPEGYGGLRDANPAFDMAGLSTALNKPAVQSAWKQARLGGDLVENSPLDAMIQRLSKANPGRSPAEIRAAAEAVNSAAAQDAGAGAADRAPSFDDLQQLHRTLRGKAKAAFAKGDGATGKSFETIADHVGTALEEGSKGYKAINAEYARRGTLEKALLLGQEWFDKPGDIVGMKKAVASLSPEELTQFRIGLAHKQIVQLQTMSGANAASKAVIAKNAPARAAMLKTIFGDEKTFETFVEAAKQTRGLGFLSKAVGGSETHGRGAAAKVALADELGVAGEVLKPSNHSLKHKAVKAIWDHSVGPILERRADRMTPQLLTQGADNIDALLNAFEASRPKGPGPVVTNTVPASIGSLFGSQRSH